jgi:hypothetical protein
MDKKLARKVAEQVVAYLFQDVMGKPVSRLMLVYGGEEFNNPGWGREAIRETIIQYIEKAAQPARAGDVCHVCGARLPALTQACVVCGTHA